MEIVIITRKNEKNVVLMILEQYNKLTKVFQNAEYLERLDRALKHIEQGNNNKYELIEDK